MDAGIEVTASATLTSRLLDLSAQLPDLAFIIAEKTATAVLEAAQTTTPVDTGALVESIDDSRAFWGDAHTEFVVRTHGSAAEHASRKGWKEPDPDYSYADYVRRGVGFGDRQPNPYMEQAAADVVDSAYHAPIKI